MLSRHQYTPSERGGGGGERERERDRENAGREGGRVCVREQGREPGEGKREGSHDTL